MLPQMIKNSCLSFMTGIKFGIYVGEFSNIQIEFQLIWTPCERANEILKAASVSLGVSICVFTTNSAVYYHGRHDFLSQALAR